MQSAERPSYVMSLGGSLMFRGTDLDTDYLPKFAGVLQEFINDQRAQFFIPTGGGPPARLVQSEYVAKGIRDPDFLDKLGIQVTHENAKAFVDVLHGSGVDAAYVPALTADRSVASVLVTGGTEPKQTTDAVAVAWAHMLGLNRVFNITNIPNVYRYRSNGLPDQTRPIHRISADSYLRLVGPTHRIGEHLPAGRIGIQMAKLYEIDFLVMGRDLPNIARALRGLHFRGTLIHP